MPTNVFQVPSFIANEGMRLLKNNLKFIKNINTDYESHFTQTPRKGESISVRLPNNVTARSGETFTPGDYVERTTTMTVQTTDGVDLQFSNRELMFNFERFSERVIAPAMHVLANTIEKKALALAMTGTYQYVGTPGTIPNSLKTYNQARALMSWESAPQDGHTLLITPDMSVEGVDAQKSIFNPSGAISKSYQSGQLGDHYGAAVFECQNLYTHTVGPLGGTPLVNGVPTAAGQNDQTSTVATKGWTAAAALRLRKNDIIQYAGVFAINPWTKQSTGKLRNFVVQSDTSSDASGNASVVVSPALKSTGPYQNISNLPADNAVITVVGTANQVSPQGLRYHRDGFLFGSFDQPMPTKAVEICKDAKDADTGITLRFIRDWDTKNNVEINRYDVVWAFGRGESELAVRIQS